MGSMPSFLQSVLTLLRAGSTSLSRGEVGGGDESPWPTIGASVGLGTTAGAGLDPLAGHVRGVDRRLGHHGEIGRAHV